MEQWQDQGIVLSVRRHGESGAIVSLLTEGQGRAAGYVRGAQGSKMRGTLEVGNIVDARWQSRTGIDLDQIQKDGIKTKIFEGSALAAAQGFPANVNVAATLSLAGIGAENTHVEIWADPAAVGNTHEITVTGEFSTLNMSIVNKPDPANPKSSMLAAQSIVAILKDMNTALVVL